MIILPHVERELCRNCGVGRTRDKHYSSAKALDSGRLFNIRCIRFCLTRTGHRRNKTYRCELLRRAYGQTQEVRPETAGTPAHRHSQPQLCGHLRRIVSREPVLRPQRPATSALRDAATPSRRGPVHRRGGRRVRRLSPNLLSGPDGFRTCRPDRAVAQTARPQARSQAFRGSHRAGAAIENCLTWSNYHRMPQSYQREVRNHRSPSQPRTSAAGQKKTPLVERRFRYRLMPARPTSYCANEWLSPMDRSSPLKAEALSFVAAWRGGRNYGVPRRLHHHWQHGGPATLKRQGRRCPQSSSNLLPV